MTLSAKLKAKLKELLKYSDDQGMSTSGRVAISSGFHSGVQARDEDIVELVEALEKFVLFELHIIKRYTDDYMSEKWKDVYDTARTALKKWQANNPTKPGKSEAQKS